MMEKILVVDDEREIADRIELYLTNESYAVIKCYNATDALRFVNQQEMDAARYEWLRSVPAHPGAAYLSHFDADGKRC